MIGRVQRFLRFQILEGLLRLSSQPHDLRPNETKLPELSAIAPIPNSLNLLLGDTVCSIQIV